MLVAMAFTEHKTSPTPQTGPSEPTASFSENCCWRILLVEDHASTLQVLGRLLQRDGHQVTAATSVAGALLAAETGSYDLLISDLGLPDGNGIDLMRYLHPAHGMTGIALSGHGRESDIAATKDAGFVGHLTKPVGISVLRQSIADALAPHL